MIEQNLGRDKQDDRKQAVDKLAFRYVVEVTADRDLQFCFGILAFRVGGSPGAHFEKIGNLRKGVPKRIVIRRPEIIEAVGNYHVFSRGKEIRNSDITNHSIQDELTRLKKAFKGVPLTDLMDIKRNFPHRVSSDGQFLLTFRDRESHLALIVVDLTTFRVVKDVSIGEHLQWIYDLEWISPDEVIFILGPEYSLPRWLTRYSKLQREREFNLYRFNLADENPELLRKDVRSIFQSKLTVPDTVVLRDSKNYSLFKFNYRTGKKTKDHNPKVVTGWQSGYRWMVYDLEGNPRMTRKRQGARVGWRYLDRATETWKPLDSLNREPGVAFNYNAKSLLEQQVFLKRFSPDPNSIYIFTNHRNGRMELDLYNLKQGRIERRLFASEGYDWGGPNVPSARILYEKNGWEAIGLVSQARMPTVTWLDERFKNHQDRMDAFFPDCVNIPLDWSENGSVMIYHSFNEKSFGRIFVFRPEKNEIRQIYNRSPKLDNQVLGTMSFLSFKSRDGYSLHGYLTLPPGSEGRNLPLLVYPHGGPMVRDTWGFDPRVQYFATRGYAVMQVNYRGSSGYGIEHCRSGLEGELGGVIIDDIADGARFLISEGIADPDRIAIAGASFGGYCTYMSLIRYPELYQVGVAVAAISHWRNLLNTNQYYGNQYGFRFWKEIIRRSSDDDYAKKISPYFRANEFSRPVKIIHGKLDYTVPYGQATIMEKALKNAGKEVELVVFPYQGHSILSFSTYGMNQGIRYLEEIEVFLDKHLPPKRKVTDEDTVTLVPSSSPVAGSP